ncbi:MAG: M3 family oligoendopeptidase [Nitrospirae bacterium]|nr:M3 family oligoendopeptidase [Nitrospirota bacterium]
MTVSHGLEVERLEPTAWNLAELLPEPSEEVIVERLASLEVMVQSFEDRRGDLSADMGQERLLDVVHQYEALVEQVEVLAAYGYLWFASDTQDQAALDFKNRIEQVLTDAQNRVLFFSLWWKQLDDEAAEALLPSDSRHSDWRHFLQNLRRLRPFTLDESSEQLINLKDADGMDAVLTLYSMLTNRLEFRLEVDGDPKVLTRDQLVANVYSPDPDLRQATYRELFRSFGSEATLLGQIYIHRLRDWYGENVQLRGFASPIAVRNTANDIPDEAVETLLEVVREKSSLYQRYFRLKAEWLGMERLSRYDLYAPLAGSQKEIPYSEGVGLVLDTFAAFHPELAANAERVFAEGHIDSAIRKGKKGGAFCYTVLPSQTPWLLANYTGRVRDVATLAHELGHAIHSMMAADHSVLAQQPVLPLAETASVFAEMLLTDRLLEEEQDPLVRRELLASAVDDIYATVLRQAFFVRFEIAAHDAVRAGKSVADLNTLYQAGLEEQFGDSVEIGPEFRHEWITIPHIYQTPFYCYAYSFGQLLVLALYRRYKEEGEAFIPGYLELLAAGGSQRPQEILSRVGVDITDPEFWRGGFSVVEDLIDQLETATR